MLRSVLETIVQYYALGRHRESKSVIKSTGPGIWSKGIQRGLLRDYGLTFGARLTPESIFSVLEYHGTGSYSCSERIEMLHR